MRHPTRTNFPAYILCTMLKAPVRQANEVGTGYELKIAGQRSNNQILILLDV
jgi:hypothetical protein